MVEVTSTVGSVLGHLVFFSGVLLDDVELIETDVLLCWHGALERAVVVLELVDKSDARIGF